MVHAVTVIALQDPLPAAPLLDCKPGASRRRASGERPGSVVNRPNDLGIHSFAAVFISLCNSSRYAQSVRLQKVEIIALENRAPQLCKTDFDPVQLRPGEQRTLDIFLNRAAPYDTEGLVKAIAIYEVRGKIHVIGSMAVPIRIAP